MKSTAETTLLVLLAAGCQRYDFAFQPDTDLQESALRFSVETPSQADILFVVDNSISMTEEQDALKSSFEAFIADLAATDTDYRIGVVSTDAVGWPSETEGDCSNNPFPAPVENGSKGDCTLGATSQIRYPHDGARGRLLAAYDPNVYRIDNPFFERLLAERLLADEELQLDEEALAILVAEELAALARLFPTGTSTGPCEDNALALSTNGGACSEANPPYRIQCQRDGAQDVECESQGVEYVIDRQLVNLNACKACGVAAGTCERGNERFDGCATRVAEAYINAAFTSNINGLGIDGQGWEQGIRSGLLAIGIEPAEQGDVALQPPIDLTDPTRRIEDAPNTFFDIDEVGNAFRTSWIRNKALFAMMVVTDEQECSMSPSFFSDGKNCFEEGCEINPGNNEPTGSVCYQDVGRANLIGVERMHELLTEEKATRVAIGFIGGLVRPDSTDRSTATPTDCVSNELPSGGQTEATPSVDCRCVTDAPGDLRWCAYTTNDPTSSTTCDALGGDRYTQFANLFSRRTYESVCRADFSAALIDFGDIAKLSCFDLDDEVSPANRDASNIQVLRSPRDLAEAGVAPTVLPRVAEGSASEGWYYLPGSPKDQICLNRLDRLIGDQYEIRILTTDSIDPRRSRGNAVQ